MKQYTYAELKVEVDRRKKEKSEILGSCCNCGVEVKKSDLRTHHFEGDAYCCKHCNLYLDELLIFCCLLACVQGKKSWEVFRNLESKK